MGRQRKSSEFSRGRGVRLVKGEFRKYEGGRERDGVGRGGDLGKERIRKVDGEARGGERMSLRVDRGVCMLQGQAWDRKSVE